LDLSLLLLDFTIPVVLAEFNFDAFQSLMIYHFAYPLAISTPNHFLYESFMLLCFRFIPLRVILEDHLLNLYLHHCGHHLTLDENLLAIIEPGK
jgi:hypothetical protein